MKIKSRSLKAELKKVGDQGEDLAAEYLERKGYTILQRNFRRRSGEIDLIAYRKGVLAFCEVKSSRYRGESHPEIRVDCKKQIKLTRCARAYLLANPPPFEACRFDVIAVKAHQGRTVVEHIENAFWPPDGWEEE